MDELKRLYIEPSSHCNLACKICSRNYWKNEMRGYMDAGIFKKIMGELPRSVETVFFGGIGEPMCHPDILDMIKCVKQKDLRCELITNGTLLNESLSELLVASGLDMLWASVDSLEGGEGGARIFNNLEALSRLLGTGEEERLPLRLRNALAPSGPELQLGIAYVLTKSSANSLGLLVKRAAELGVSEIKTTHLLPYTAEMEDDICYGEMFPIGRSIPGTGVKIDLPFLDADSVRDDFLPRLLIQGSTVMSHIEPPASKSHGYCKFVQEGMSFIRWDGEVAPCMSLLHENHVFQNGRRRELFMCSFGNIDCSSLSEIWNSDEYSRFRKRVTDFDFSPCASCASCELFDDNTEDCCGSPFPACGHCLWAHGLIQCP